MAEFIYKAITSRGQVVSNRVEDVSKNNLIKKLKDNDLYPISVKQVGNRSRINKLGRKNILGIDDKMTSISFQPKITTRDIIIFTQNFYLLKKANFNNIHALTTIIDSTENLALKEVLQDILAGVDKGEYIYTTMEHYSDIFPYIYTNMIKVGEESGSLTESLGQAVKYLEKTEKTSKQLKKIIIPNAIQLVVLLMLLIFGVAYIIPLIQRSFASVGSTSNLPGITLGFVSFCNGIYANWHIMLIIIAIIVAGIIAYINTPKGKYNYHYFKYKMPIFGKLIYAIDFSRLMKAMLLNLKNGMKLDEALEVSKTVVNNHVMLSMVERAIDNILIGESWIEPFETSGLSSSMQTEMLKIGMQTDLIEMMEKLVDYMDIDVDNLMKNVMNALPQIVYSIVGLALIFLVIVIIVPCIQLYMGDWLFDSVDLPDSFK